MRLLGYMILLGCLGCATYKCTSAPPVSSTLPQKGSTSGYILFSPLLSTTTYLINMRGEVVHTWASDFPPGASVYLLENAHLLRCGRQPGVPVFSGGGEGGRIQEFTWEGALAWEFILASGERLQHHDIKPLPNGHVLLIAWERKTAAQAIAAGREVNQVGQAGLWPDFVLEVRPEGPKGGTVVWEWHVWDHLVQDHNPGAANYGRVADHPELVDINGGGGRETLTETLVQQLRTLGYLAGKSTPPDRFADFMHTNAIAYNPKSDQIALSVNAFNEIWVIDHGTTTGEAAGHKGGNSERGGDLLYRWGNPGAYGRGAASGQKLFGNHDVRWIPDDCPGAGHLMVFNNGAGRAGAPFSSVMEIDPPVDNAGRYTMATLGRFGPEKPAWEYTAAHRESFFAEFISGAERLPNGNTLVCDGPRGHFFEVTMDGKTVWEYQNPYSGNAPNPHGDPAFSVFRATHIPSDHPGLKGRLLAPPRSLAARFQ